MQKRDEVIVEVGQRFPLTIKKLGINGEGVGYFKRKATFIEGALPGEEVVAEVTKSTNNFIEAKLIKVRKPSEYRVKADCDIYDKCGGCQIRHMSYNAQLEEKRSIVLQSLEKYIPNSTDKIDVRQTIGMENPNEYRNKSQLQVGNIGGEVALGLYQAGSHVLQDLTECNVQNPILNSINKTIKSLIRKYKIPVYNEKRETGILRTVVTRVSTSHNKAQVTLIVTKNEVPSLDSFVKELVRRHREVISVFININAEKTSLIFGNKTEKIYGKDVIPQELGEIKFDLSPRSFFQLNPEQTIKLYNEVEKACLLTGKENVIDAYCGVGTIGLWLSKSAKEVRGMDTIREAIEDAKKNAELNDKENVTFEVGTAEHWVPRWISKGWNPDVVVIDPPRTGCDSKLLDTLLTSKAKRIVYVSCNPSTLAKDLTILTKNYKVCYIQPVDMFPMTGHVETVCLLEIK
ncbi:MAG: rlmCD 2 [Bacillales bacterium]|jgi:23S rRNA (uracil-5-)-methyltransferase RumA|nr:rlmCD 2 [Bacillales bacterium]